MNDPIQVLCEIDDVPRLRRVAFAYEVKILNERPAPFIDGSSKVQFTVEVDGVRGLLVPASDAARERQNRAGRHLKPYCFVLL